MSKVRLNGFRVVTLAVNESCLEGDPKVLYKQVPGEFCQSVREAKKAVTAIGKSSKLTTPVFYRPETVDVDLATATAVAPEPVLPGTTEPAVSEPAAAPAPAPAADPEPAAEPNKITKK